jgi:ATP-binding cassette subfamily A (ABC1) protein 3
MLSMCQSDPSYPGGISCPLIDGKVGFNFAGKQSPLAWDITGANLVFLLWEAVAYFIITLLIEYSLTFPTLLAWLYSAGLKDTYSGGGLEDEDVDVATERERVRSGRADGDVVRISELRKVYQPTSARMTSRMCSISSSVQSGENKLKLAVQSLSFGIPRGECFGFLGINGAGKTTTLSILSGEFPPTYGSAYIDGFSISEDQTKIRRRIGYCPQFDALLELLTVREHLELFGRIKGMKGQNLKRVVEGKLDQLDLRNFEHKTAGSLSGGNKRKLSVAMATIGEPPIVFLDEPSTGMDPVARRFMWQVIARMSTHDARCSVILTTHSMEEAEALCTRIGVSKSFLAAVIYYFSV